MNPISQTLACCPLKYPGTKPNLERLGEGWEVSEDKGRSCPRFISSGIRGLEVLPGGRVPREEGGGGEHCMSPTSGNVRGGPRRQQDTVCVGGGPGSQVGGWERECVPLRSRCPRPQDTQTHSLSPLLKPTMDYLGLKGGQRGEREGREPVTKTRPFSPQRPFRNKINGMCLSTIPRGLGGGVGGMWGLLSRLPSFSHIDHHGNQSPLLPR